MPHVWNGAVSAEFGPASFLSRLSTFWRKEMRAAGFLLPTPLPSQHPVPALRQLLRPETLAACSWDPSPPWEDQLGWQSLESLTWSTSGAGRGKVYCSPFTDEELRSSKAK